LHTKIQSKSLFAFVVLFLAACARAQNVDVDNPPQGRFLDEWFELHMGGGKIGYAHNSTSREKDRVETSTQFHIKIGRADQPVVMDTTQRTVETVQGAPLEFETQMRFSQMSTSMRGKVQDGKITLVSSQFGMEQTQVFDFPNDALLAWGLFREQVKRGFAQGTRYSLKTYAPEIRLDDAIAAHVSVGGWEQFTLQGKAAQGQRVTVTMEAPTGSLDMVSWVNKEGLPLRSKVVMPGLGDMEMYAVGQAAAMADFVPPEVFMTTVLKANRRIDAEKAGRIRYRLRAKQPGAELSALPETDSQKITRVDDQTVEVTVTRQEHGKGNAETPKRGNAETNDTKNGELAEYLGSNLMINIKDDKLIALAKTAAGGEREPFALADKLRKFVTDYVTIKNLNVGFASASEVARTREGDCSEHGVLLAALARLNGLPSRVAVGLAYVPIFGGQADIFGYHLWTQVYIDGKWLDIDAALRETECSPIRITFAVSSLKNSGVADLNLPLISKIGAIDMEILDIESQK